MKAKGGEGALCLGKGAEVSLQARLGEAGQSLEQKSLHSSLGSSFFP